MGEGGGEGGGCNIGGSCTDGLKKKLSQMIKTIRPISAAMIKHISALFARARRPIPIRSFFDLSSPELAKPRVARDRSSVCRCCAKSERMLAPIASVSSAVCAKGSRAVWGSSMIPSAQSGLELIGWGASSRPLNFIHLASSAKLLCSLHHALR